MKYNCIKSFLIAIAAGIIAAMVFLVPEAEPAHAETTDPDWDNKVTCYFTVTDVDSFVKVNGKAVALDELEIPYFDLENYGMQDLYYNEDCYTGGSQKAGTKEQAYGNVTLLHLFIYATEIYRCGVDPEDAGKGYLYEHNWPYFRVFARTPGSAFVRFWEFAENINYYVNYEYPLGRIGWGSTCDQIRLYDGDIVSVKYDENRSEEQDGTYYLFNDGATCEDTLYKNFTPVTLYKTSKTADYSGTGRKTAGAGHTVKVQREIGGEVLVSGVTNSYGDVRLDTRRLPRGTYYITSDTKCPGVMMLNIRSSSDSDELITGELERTILGAETELEGIIVSADGAGLVYGTRYTSEENKTALSDAITAAKAALANENASQTDIDTAYFALDDALKAFRDAVLTKDDFDSIVALIENLPKEIEVTDREAVEKAREAFGPVNREELDDAGKSTYDLMEAKLEAAEAKLEAAEATAAAEKAEQERKLAEQEKQAAERARQAAEEAGATAEKARQAAEAAKAEAERNKSEAEDKLKKAEEKAAKAEAALKKAEKKFAEKIGKVTLKKVKGARKKVTVTWKKVTGAKGYEITVARNKKCTKNVQTYTVKGNKAKKVIKKLKKGKYFVKVRAYKTVNGNTLSGKWSKVKSVKVK